MREFFLSQMDYVYFIYGFSFICLAAAAFYIHAYGKKSASWKWIGGFGLLHGLVEWLDLVEMSAGTYPMWLKIIKLALNAGSFLCLVEGARVSRTGRQVQAPGAWIHLILLAALVPGWLAGGLGGINALSRYLFGGAGGLWLAGELMIAMQDKEGRRWRQWLGMTLGLYACTQLVIARTSFGWAPVVNQEAFFALTNVPLPMVRALLAFTLAVLAWKYYVDITYGTFLAAGGRLLRVLPVIIVVVLAAGWFVTCAVSGMTEREDRDELLSIVKGVGATLEIEPLKQLKGSAQDAEDPHYRAIKETFQRVDEHLGGLRYLYLMGKRDGKVFFFADSEPKRFALSGAKPTAAPGDSYAEASPGVLNAFDRRQALVEGPYTDTWGTFISGLFPLMDPVSGRVVAVLGMDFLADAWTREAFGNRLHVIFVVLLIALIILAFLLINQREMDVRGILAEQSREKEQEHHHLEMIFQSTHAGLLLIDGGLKIVRLNKVASDMGAQDFFSAAERSLQLTLSGMAAAILQTGKAVKDAEVIHRGRKAAEETGEIVLIVNALPLEVDGQRQVLFSMMDISARRAADNAVKESSARLDLALKAAGMGAWRWDIPRDLFYWDEQTCRIFKIDPPVSQVTGEEFYRLVHPQDRDAVKTTLARALKTGTDERQYRVLWADGSERHISARGRVLYDQQGRPLEVNGVLWDITEERRLQEEQRRHIRDLEIFYKASIGREERILDLKKEVVRLKMEAERQAEGFNDETGK